MIKHNFADAKLENDTVADTVLYNELSCLFVRPPVYSFHIYIKYSLSLNIHFH